MIVFSRRSWRSAGLALLLPLSMIVAIAVFISPARSQAPTPSEATQALPGPFVSCPTWKPTWESAPLPNSRSQPYIRVPLDPRAFAGGVLGPVLLDGQPPNIQLFIRDSSGALTPLPISKEVAGPPYPAPASERVFWDEPSGGFPKNARMVVFLQVSVKGSGPSGEDQSTAPDQWLRFDLSGGIPTIDRSAIGPVQVGGDGNYVPNQQMLNGSMAPAFHASVRIGLPQISTRQPSDHVYVLSDNLLSSREQDESTRIRLATGWVRSLPAQDPDLMPNISTEAWVQSNQAASNQGAGIALGRLIYGKPWNAPVGNGLYAALSPRIQLYPLQYTYLFRRDLRIDPGFTEKAYVDPSAEIVLSPFFLGLKKGQTATIEDHTNLSLGVRGWYVSGLGPEYRYVARIQFPVRIWHLSEVGLSYYRGADENAYFRYSNGVSFDFSLRH